MQYSFDSQHRAHTARFLGPKIITTYKTMPRPSLLGGIVAHYYLNRIHAWAHVIGVSKSGRKGLIVDAQEDRSEHKRRNITAAVPKGFGEQDIFTEHLSLVAAPDQLIPPAAHFTNIRAASLFFCTEELKIYHKNLAEVSWTEESFLPIQEAPLLNDPEIHKRSSFLDCPGRVDYRWNFWHFCRLQSVCSPSPCDSGVWVLWRKQPESVPENA